MFVWYTFNGWRYVYTFSDYIGCGFEGGLASESYWLIPGTEE